MMGIKGECFLQRLNRYISLIRIFFYNHFNKKVSIGKGTNWRKDFMVQCVTGRIKIGKGCFFNNGCSLNCKDTITIGDHCLFGENVKLYDHNHVYQDITQPIAVQGFTTAPIRIGNNCWIGSNVTILKGVEIGGNTIIGANCLIYKSIPEGSIVTLSQELNIRRRGNS